MSPRIPPLRDDEMNEKQKKLAEPFAANGQLDNVFRTIAQHPDLLERWVPYVAYILLKSKLSPRQREILILRIGYLCGCEYEWAQHVRGAKAIGLSDADVAFIMGGSGLAPEEDVLLRTADELHRDARVGDATWALLATYYDRKQLMDIVFTVGQYNMVSMALNSFGVEVDSYLLGTYPKLPTNRL